MFAWLGCSLGWFRVCVDGFGFVVGFGRVGRLVFVGSCCCGSWFWLRLVAGSMGI